MADTIAAIATGAQVAAIGIIRISGPEALPIVDRLFRPASGKLMSEYEDRKLVYGRLTDLSGDLLDLCLCTVSHAPHSYTGEDTAELQCHGSPTVLRAALEELTGEVRTMVFHEAPHRLRSALADMAEVLGDRPVALCRELTKLHEETVRTTLAQAAAYYAANEPRGEYVLVVAGRPRQYLPQLTLEEGVERVLRLREGGMKMKDAVRQVADDTGLSRNELYNAALQR